MGTARLNVWVREKDRPCNPDMQNIWSVDVITCDGGSLYWCGTRYYGAHKTEHGHVEIEVPPGCYIVRARSACNNVFTHATMVVVNCDETACVNLVVPGIWTCGRQFNHALRFQAAIGHIPDDLAITAIKANQAVLDHLTEDMFPEEDQEILDEMLEKRKEDDEEGGIAGDP